MSARAKFVIQPFKFKDKTPTRQELRKEAVFHEALKLIARHQASNVAFEDVYRTAYNMVLKLEPENADAKQQLENVVYQVNASNQTGEADPERQKRAMADPEIQAILGDAQMRSILQEMQTDPAKAQKAMRDPTIAGKLEKIIAAGVLQVR